MGAFHVARAGRGPRLRTREGGGGQIGATASRSGWRSIAPIAPRLRGRAKAPAISPLLLAAGEVPGSARGSYRLASTRARTARRIGSGSVGHAFTMAAKSGDWLRRSAKQSAKSKTGVSQLAIE